MCLFIVLELEWKSLSSPQPDHVVETAGTIWTSQLNLEITVIKRLAPRMVGHGYDNILNFLTDDAFRAKSHTNRIEKRNL